jgi:ribosomal protein S27E
MLTLDCPFCDAPVTIPEPSATAIRCEACSVVAEFTPDEVEETLAAAA